MTISGEGFASGAKVTVGSIAATVLSVSGTQITANFTAASTGGSQSVTVTVNSETSNSVNFFDQIATSLSIVTGTDSTTKESTCSTSKGTDCGVARTFHYQVNDQATPPQPIEYYGLQVWDSFATPSYNGLGLGFTTTCTPFGKTNGGPCGVVTNASGQFAENLNDCSTVCYSGSACVTGSSSAYTQVKQTWHVDTHPIVQSITYYCNRVLVNGQ
jgi:hypothetical protein